MVCKSLNKSGHGQNLDWMNFGSTHEGRDVIGFWMHGDASYTELRFVFIPIQLLIWMKIEKKLLEPAQQLQLIALFTPENGFPQLFVGHLSMNIFAVVKLMQKIAIHIF